MIIKWKEEYSLGVEKIDQQHRKLFEIAGRAYELLKDELRIDKYDEIVAILEELKIMRFTIFNQKRSICAVLVIGNTCHTKSDMMILSKR